MYSFVKFYLPKVVRRRYIWCNFGVPVRPIKGFGLLNMVCFAQDDNSQSEGGASPPPAEVQPKDRRGRKRGGRNRSPGSRTIRTSSSRGRGRPRKTEIPGERSEESESSFGSQSLKPVDSTPVNSTPQGAPQESISEPFDFYAEIGALPASESYTDQAASTPIYPDQVIEDTNSGGSGGEGKDWRVAMFKKTKKEQVSDLLSIKDSELNNLPEKGIEFITFNNHIFSLRYGFVLKQGKDKKGNHTVEVVPESLPEPLPIGVFDVGVSSDYVKRYHLYVLKLKYQFRIKISHFLIRTMVSLIFVSRNFPSSNVPEGHVDVPFNALTGSREGILSEAWGSTQSVGSNGFINVSDSLSQTKRYMYTGSVPTYKIIEETEAVSLVFKWLNRFYNQIPGEIDTVEFVKRFLIFLTPKNFITPDAFKQLQPAGCSFENVFAHITPEKQHIVELLYTTETITLSPPIKAIYQTVSLNDKSNKIVIKKETLNFLEVICGDSAYNKLVLRIFLRNVISAPYEGRNWQSAVYLHGAAGTAKSVWAHITRRLVPEGAVQEFSRHQTQFTPGQLENCQLLIISDLIHLNSKQLEVLKRVLGRDTITSERKYHQEFGVISPNCQVLIISNFPPEHFYLFANDQAILDKLIKVYLGPQYQIPQPLQVPNIGDKLDPFLPDLMNWSMYLQAQALSLFTRAVLLNRIHDKLMGVPLVRIPGFIYSCTYQGAPKESDNASFTTTTNLKESYLNYLTATGQGVERSDKERTEGELAIIICKSLNTVFDTRGRTYTIDRWTKRQRIDNKLRPNGIWGLCITNGKEAVNRDDASMKERYFEIKESSADPATDIVDPFGSDNVIPWIQSAESISKIGEAQELILAERRKSQGKKQIPSPVSSEFLASTDNPSAYAPADYSLEGQVYRTNENEPYPFFDIPS